MIPFSLKKFKPSKIGDNLALSGFDSNLKKVAFI
jgi:hypothetical protein